MSQYEINLLKFDVLQEQVEFYFSLIEKPGYVRVYKGNLPKEFPNKEAVEKFAWWSLVGEDSDTYVPVSLFGNKRFSKSYFSKVIYKHFEDSGALIDKSFIGDTVIYSEENTGRNDDHQKYKRFSLRVDNNNLATGPTLLLSYEGETIILRRNIQELKLNPTLLGRVKYKEKISKFSELSAKEQAESDQIFPVLNRNIRVALGLPFTRNYSDNKYKKYHESIVQFYGENLSDKTLGGAIRILKSGFHKIYQGQVNTVSEDSNLLLFGGNQKNFTPYNGIKEYGPISGPPSNKPIKFIFIFHEEDRNFANKLYTFFKKGYKGFPGLESFAGISFEIDDAKTIRFTKENPIPEIKSTIESFTFDADTKYAAMYLSRVKKDSDDEEEDLYYYQLKELLLRHNIASQVIFRENINNPSFNFFLPNIAIALLAKLGGVPWRLYRQIKNDLIVGVGVSRSSKDAQRFSGNAFCFRNDGLFRGFNVFEEGNTHALAHSIEQAINQYVSENTEFDRLIIHYYKRMREEEERPISELLRRLHPNVPYVVLTINETASKDYVLFDIGYDGKMPQSGTFLKIKWNEFLLCNNTRYSNSTATKIDGFPFPIKIKMHAPGFEKFDDFNLVRDLIDQVYQFSRMYWKSVRQRPLPVTIEYSKLVAKVVSQFEEKELVPFARNTLWFL